LFFLTGINHVRAVLVSLALITLQFRFELLGDGNHLVNESAVRIFGKNLAVHPIEPGFIQFRRSVPEDEMGSLALDELEFGIVAHVFQPFPRRDCRAFGLPKWPSCNVEAVSLTHWFRSYVGFSRKGVKSYYLCSPRLG